MKIVLNTFLNYENKHNSEIISYHRKNYRVNFAPNPTIDQFNQHP